jgi:50S ribosomal subunit-associated GTPase HflX
VKAPAILAFNKSDIAPSVPQAPPHVTSTFQTVVFVSATTQDGLDSLRNAILQAAGLPQIAPGDNLRKICRNSLSSILE